MLLIAVDGSCWFFDNGVDAGGVALIGVTLINALFWYLMFEIIRVAGPVFFATYNFISPLAGIGWGMIIFAERHSPRIWGALALMVIGLYLANRRKGAA